MKINSNLLKICLVSYFRYKSKCLTATEYLGSDVIADNGKYVIEIEVKISKSDLLYGEKKKDYKHNHLYKNDYNLRYVPNRYYFCVPTNLIDIALGYAHKLNPKYGVIEFISDASKIEKVKENPFSCTDLIVVRKRAGLLHKEYFHENNKKIAKHVSNRYAKLLQKFLLLNDKGISL